MLAQRHVEQQNPLSEAVEYEIASEDFPVSDAQSEELPQQTMCQRVCWTIMAMFLLAVGGCLYWLMSITYGKKDDF